ncbi:hypothetical protein DVH24_028219 [Malus domestica]|uniref:Uncharacterized protein n=1 Tax=Malus domestica TaxID=3750 RepID=A0A498HDW8_MALDO|nr:hypothetical protein DVH24_028219 [Malus domestica]
MGSGRAEKPGPCGICGGGDRWRGRLLYERLFSMIVKHLRLWIFECREPSHEAFKLGLAAAGLLVLAHVVANLLGGCNCICSQDELQKAPPNKQLSMACLVFTWYIHDIRIVALFFAKLRPNFFLGPYDGPRSFQEVSKVH